ncbi:hypothetical protein C5167_042028 [Papaver somniferum]|uniref:hexokinase-4, chloroplastic-like n=1 Tax=Papaver somniferum TaxID=3469 RepID=UPI000E6F4857|nr:hexokinase-4, chloroplastic-like [Papaver somniferum]RZC87098.1 hypothetical protein C5167_042028 [Papaver somniferum]
MGDCSKTISENSILEILQDECATPIDVLNRVAESMIAHMKAGLNVDGARDLKMLLSYVNNLPTKQETGLFYALDIGGTNCRVLRVKLDGEDIDIHKISREIPAELKTGTSKELFGFIALGLRELVNWEFEAFGIQKDTKREIGFTFSFPVEQTSINKGTLIEWTKEFNISDTIGEDVVACLVEAMKEQELDMFSVTALVNDTVGTLAGARYKDSDVKVAVILGTGTNACYIERTDVIPKLNRQGNQGHVTGNTIINTEWGAFSEGLPLTEFDQDLGTDLGKQIFEKMISGKYLGEIVSRILLKMAESENLFGEHYTPSAVLSTRELNEMQQDDSDDLKSVGLILNETFKVETTLSTRKTAVEVIDAIVKRGARLAGAGIVGILKKMEQDTEGFIYGKRSVVAIDGSLYEQYPQYKLYLKETVKELLGPEKFEYVVIEQFHDASGVGAALLADTNSKVYHLPREICE